MTARRPILEVGLTGGIASGKTTVAAFLAEEGAFVLDADRIAHEITSPGTRALRSIVDRFGDGILGTDGSIDRRALGKRVFGDAAARRDLEAIVHPGVREEVARRIDLHRAEGSSDIVVFDAALLVETGDYRNFHRLVVVRCSRETQIRRQVDRGGVSPDEAVRRVDAQLPLGQKLEVADYVIDTETGLEDTRRQTARVYAALLEDFDKTFRRQSC